jgi:excisionase family DNA binding protein
VNGKQENEPAVSGRRLLTREELAEALKVSLRTVDLMIQEKEIVPVRPGGRLVRFYLPDVVRQLTARALISKRGCSRKFVASEGTARGQETERTESR